MLVHRTVLYHQLKINTLLCLPLVAACVRSCWPIHFLWRLLPLTHMSGSQRLLSHRKCSHDLIKNKVEEVKSCYHVSSVLTLKQDGMYWAA